MNQIDNFPCKCGHSSKVHKRTIPEHLCNEYYDALMCLVAGEDTTEEECPCYEYVPNNPHVREKWARYRRHILKW